MKMSFLQAALAFCAFVWHQPLFPANAPEMTSPADLELTAERAPALASERMFVNK